MGDQHQVKTSFLFIQLQSPCRAQQCHPSADSLSLVNPEGVSSAATAADLARPSVGDLQSIYTREEESITACKNALDDTSLQSVESEPTQEEALSPLFVAGIIERSHLSDSSRTDNRTANRETTLSSSCECLTRNGFLNKTDSQESLSCELNKSLNSVSGEDSSEEHIESRDIRLLCQDPPETMSEVIPSPSLGNFPKSSLGSRVSFLYPSTESDFQNRTTPLSPDLSPPPSAVPPARAPTSSFSSTYRPSHSSWVHSAKHKEEAVALEKPQTAERTTFVSAVIRRSSKLYGDVSKPAHSSFEVTSDTDKSSKNLSLAVVDTKKPNQTPLATESLHTKTAPSTMLRSTAPEKVRLPLILVMSSLNRFSSLKHKILIPAYITLESKTLNLR